MLRSTSELGMTSTSKIDTKIDTGKPLCYAPVKLQNAGSTDEGQYLTERAVTAMAAATLTVCISPSFASLRRNLYAGSTLKRWFGPTGGGGIFGLFVAGSSSCDSTQLCRRDGEQVQRMERTRGSKGAAFAVCDGTSTFRNDARCAVRPKMLRGILSKERYQWSAHARTGRACW